MSALTILNGDALQMLRTLPDCSVQCCVTSPPYWGLRDYGCAGQIGLEATVDEFIAKLVEVFREVRRVLKSDGTAWVNMGDAYPEAHFATFPPALITPCILAGSRPGDTVLDPFGGSGTTGHVALEHGRKAILIELNPDYIPLIERRTTVTKGLGL